MLLHGGKGKTTCTDENGEDYSSYESEAKSNNDSLTPDDNDMEVCNSLNFCHFGLETFRGHVSIYLSHDHGFGL